MQAKQLKVEWNEKHVLEKGIKQQGCTLHSAPLHHYDRVLDLHFQRAVQHFHLKRTEQTPILWPSATVHTLCISYIHQLWVFLHVEKTCMCFSCTTFSSTLFLSTQL